MSDNIFNYFSSKGTRKVDPIDDAEFESIDAPAAPQPAQEPPPSLEVSDTTPGLDRSGNAGHVESELQAEVMTRSDSGAEDLAAPVQAKKSQSHWDYLASLLGIKKEATPEVSSENVAPIVSQTPQPVAKQKPATPPVSSRPNPFSGPSEPADTPQEAAILKTMFPAVEPAPTTEVERSRKPDPAAEDETELEFVEFEVEDLDGNTDEDPRRSRRQAPRESAPRGRSDRDRRPGSERSGGERPGSERSGVERSGVERSGGERSGGERTSVRSDGERSSRERVPRERPASGRPAPRDSRESSPEFRAPSPSRDRQGRDESQRSGEPRRELRSEPRSEPRRDDREFVSQNPIAELPEDSSFGSGVFSEAEPREEARFEDDGQRKRRRRRRRGRGGASSEVEPVAGLPRNTVAPEVDPPDDFFDEIGWQPAPSGRPSSQPSARNQPAPPMSEDDFIDDFDVDSDREAPELGPSEDRGDGASLERKKRRRRRRGKRPGETEAIGADPDRAAKSGTRQNVGRDSFDDDEDDDNVDYDQAHRNPRQARSVDEPARVKDVDSQHPDDASDKKKKFPTWEEAIAGMVESNIKNHSRYSGRSQTAKRGRRRR